MRRLRRVLVIGSVLVAALVGLPEPAAADTTRSHQLEMFGSADLGGTGDVFAGRALDDWGYNRNVVYEGSITPEHFGYCLWSSARITLVDRDGSTLTVELDPAQERRCSNLVRQHRSGHFVVTGGTGRFAGAQGHALVELQGLPVQLTGTMVLTLTG